MLDLPRSDECGKLTKKLHNWGELVESIWRITFSKAPIVTDSLKNNWENSFSLLIWRRIKKTAMFTKQDEVFMVHLWNLNTLFTYFLALYWEHWKKAIPKQHRLLILISHNRIDTFTYKQAVSHLFYTQRDQFSPVVMSTAQIIKYQKLRINAKLSTSLRYQQEAPVEIHMKRSQGQGVEGENRLEWEGIRIIYLLLLQLPASLKRIKPTLPKICLI